MKKIIKKFLNKNIKIYIKEHRYIFSEKKKKHKTHLKKLLNNNSEKLFSVDDPKKWIKKLDKLTYADPNFIEVGEAFATSEIKVIKEIKILPTDIIVICVEKNELVKLKRFFNHYRLLGINKFVILDNDSDDGSIEWLLEQEDAFILQTKTPYKTNRRVAWINRIIAHFGDDRWYLVADADELLAYSDCENKSIQELIKHFSESKIVRARAIMIDMYAKPEYYLSGVQEKFDEECVYFDTDTYRMQEWNNYIAIVGGPRERIFNTTFRLTKYPLFYFRKQDVFCNSHHMFPYKENKRENF